MSAENTTLSVLASPRVTDPFEPAFMLTTPSTVRVPSTCKSPPMSTLLWTSKPPFIVLVALESLMCNLAELISVSLIESSLVSNSFIAVDTVPAVVPIAADVIVPNSASCSLIAPTTSESCVVVRLPLQPTSAEIMFTFSWNVFTVSLMFTICFGISYFSASFVSKSFITLISFFN